MISSLFLKRKIEEKRTISDKIIDFLKKSYLPVLRWSLKLKYVILSVTLLVFLISIWGFRHLGGEFIPNLEEGDLAMQMSLPPGSSLSESMEIAGRAEKMLIDNFPEVEEVISKIGTAEVPTDPMAVEDADIMITMKDRDDWVSAKTREEIVNKMKEKLNTVAGASFDFTQPIQLRFNELMTGAKTDIAIKIFGEDMDELYAKANETASIISKIKGAADVKVEQIAGLPQLVVTYNRQKMAQYGLSVKQLNSIISAAYAGEKAGVVYEGEKKFDLVVRLNNENRNNFDLNKLFVRTSHGLQLPLSEVAVVKFISGPMQISRENTQRRVIIGINVRNRDIESLITEIRTNLESRLQLKPGYSISYGGQFQNLEAAKKRLSVAIPLALGLIMLLLFFTFNSLKYAILIFTAVPLSAIGGIAALAIRGMPFSISAGVGFIALFGVSVLNGIVLIGYYNKLNKEGIPLDHLVTEGALTRLRPVMMTALVASLGFLPMAISNSAGAEVQKPLATVVIGGLITSTLLTMIILPILYSIFNAPPKVKIKLNVPKLLMFVMFSLISASSFSQQPEAKVLSLDDAVNLALSNHPLSKNASLNVEAAQARKAGSIALDPTDFTWEYGQINSPVKDNRISMVQNFGSPFTHYQRSRLYKNEIELRQSQQKLTQKQLIAKVKEAYFRWMHQISSTNLIMQEAELYEEFLRITRLHFELGESNLLEKTMAETKYAESQRKLLTSREQLKIAINFLNLSIYSEESYQPSQPELELYSIKFPEGTADRFYPYTFKGYFEQQVKQSNIELSIEKSRLFPEISAGYFYQSIEPVKNLQGFQIGVSVPLWFLPQSARIKEARINREIAVNTASQQTYELEQTIDDLKIKLDQQFINVIYFRENALDQADLLIKMATLKLQKEEIEYTEYLQSITEAMKIKEEYLNTLLNYNLTALELEYFLN
jgi:cobalt-zinc-cadmium resistance protein CzcA